MNRIPSDELIHIGVVVRDARASAANFAAVYGIADWVVTEHEPERLGNSTTHGYASEQHFLTATGQAQTEQGPVTLRLIEPRGGWTTYQEFLLTRGEGIHHICTGSLGSDQVAALTTWLKGEGVPVAQTSRLDGGPTELLLDTRQALGGFYIQLLCGDTGERYAPADEAWDLSGAISHPGGLMPLGTFQMHFGVVVHDLMRTVTNWARLFDRKEWDFMNWRNAPGSLEEPEYMGQPVDHAYFTTLFDFGNPLLGFELIQPTFGPSHYKENYRNLVGEGIHHVNASMLPDEAQWQQARARMEAFGAPVVMGGGIGGKFAKFYYLDTGPALGYVTEVIHPDVNWEKGPQGIDTAMHASFAHPLD